MKKMYFKQTIVTTLLFFYSFSDAQTLLHYWNFNDNTSEASITKPTLTNISGLASLTTTISGISALNFTGGTGQNFDVSNLNTRNADASGTHLRFNDPIGSALVFSLPTTGYEDMIVKFATRRSGSGAGTQVWSYSTDGTNYTFLTNVVPNDGDPTLATLDLSSINAVDNNPNFKLKVEFEQGTGGTGGNNRFDNFTIEGNLTNIDLSTYVRVGRYNLPEPTRTIAPANSLLAQEVSAVTYNWDTNTLFVVGDGSTSIVQVSKTGEFIDSMTLALGSSPQGTEFYDTEGLTYIGNGQFVMSEERDRQVVKFTYAAGTTLTRSITQTVKLGTSIGNTGTEGLCFDPSTNGFIVLKEISPIGIFQTDINFTTATATNGSATTVNSINLFNPDLLNVSDVADVFALSNIPSLNGKTLYNNLLVLSQESAKVINIDRNGIVANTLTIVSDTGNPLDIANQQHEGLTLDRDGTLYIVSENGGGDFDHPQLWVYKPSTVPNTAPTAIALTNASNAILENSNTTSAVKVSDIVVTDDGLGTNNLSLSGSDASHFEIIGSSLYIKAGTVLDYETKTSYSVTVNADDTNVGASPDVTVNYILDVTNVVDETPQVVTVCISEVASWSSSNATIGSDWFEVTNNGTTALDITGWKVDDNSKSFSSAIALTGITSIAAGESVIFIENDADAAVIIDKFKSIWFGTNVPVGLQVGTYTGSGIGLSSGGDAVNLFNASGTLMANVTFGVSTTNYTFNNAAGLNDTELSTLSIIGVNDAFAAVNDAIQIGSPGTVGKLFISEVAPWSSGNSPVGADWFEVTNTKAIAVDITGWKVDDSSQSPAAAVALNGITSINPGESVLFIETNDLVGKTTTFLSNWFGTNPPSSLRIGSYTGSGIGLGSGGDQVNLYNTTSSTPQASVLFGASPTTIYTTFDNTAGYNGVTNEITTMSTVGINGAFKAANSTNEIGSPGIFKLTSATLSINTPLEVMIPFKVIAYPVPFDTSFQLELISVSSDLVQIKVFDMTGKTVEIRLLDPTEMKDQKLGDNYPSGIYNLVVIQGNKTKTLRVIKK